MQIEYALMAVEAGAPSVGIKGISFAIISYLLYD